MALNLKKIFENSVNFLSKHKLLIFIIFISLVLNIVNLEGNPVALNQDESTNGYDAFSLGKTLHDYHGNFLPFMLESYGDWASPLLTYLTIPFVLSLGLSNFSIRLPVAILGSLSVLLLYLVLQKLLKDRRVSILGSFIYAISPWLITFSRWSVPPSIVPFFSLLFILSIVNLTQEQSQKPKAENQSLITKALNIIFMGVSAALLTYTYPTLKLFVPMIFAGVFFIFLKKLYKEIILSGILYTILVSPIYILTLLDPLKYNGRYNSVSIFVNDPNPFVGAILRYLSYYTPYLYFGAGDLSMYHHVQGYPAMFEFLAPFLYLGALLLFLKASWIKESGKYVSAKNVFNYLAGLLPFSKSIARVLALWILLFPIAASITMDYFITNRALQGFAVLSLTIIFGIYGLFKMVTDYLADNKIEKMKPFILNLFTSLMIVFGVLGATNFQTIYHFQYREASKKSWNYGIKEGFDFLKQNEANFDEVLIDNRINTPDILFHLKYDPAKLLQTPKPEKFKAYGKYTRANIKQYKTTSFEIKYQVIDTKDDKIENVWVTVGEISPRKWILIYKD